MVGKTSDMHKRAFQGLKRGFMHVSDLPPTFFDKKSIYKLFGFFFIKICWGKTWDMHKRAFQTMKRTFIKIFPCGCFVENLVNGSFDKTLLQWIGA